MKKVQLLTSESELEKVADVARKENFWAKKVKKFWGKFSLLIFSPFWTREAKCFGKEVETFCF